MHEFSLCVKHYAKAIICIHCLAFPNYLYVRCCYLYCVGEDCLG